MKIPYARQSIDKKDIESVIEVLQSDFLTQGPTIELFEKKVTDFCKAKYAVAVNSATSALHLACLALGLSQDDYLWTVPNTFVASANCALYCNAKIDFVDIDLKTYNMSVEALEEKLIQAKKENKLPKIVVPVHFAGQSCDMAGIFNLSQKYGFKIIEDASHAIGGTYEGQPIGNCRYSQITIFSFHPVKIITTGEGGVAVTNDKDLKEKMSLLRSHGIVRSQERMQNKAHGNWYYEQITLGFNYRITDIQAALGISQLQKIEIMLQRRNEIAKIYQEKLKKLPLVLPQVDKVNYSAYHLYVILVKDIWQKKRKEIFDYLRNNGIMVNVHYLPVYLQPYYQKLSFKAGYCPQAEEYYQRAISLPMYYDLQNEEIDYVAKTLSKGQFDE